MEPAKLTVSELPNRPVRQVVRHTSKKAVMVIYCRADFGWAAVDKCVTAPGRAVRYAYKRMAAKRLVSALFFFGAVA